VAGPFTLKGDMGGTSLGEIRSCLWQVKVKMPVGTPGRDDGQAGGYSK
jgi:hypothetical protein